MAPNVLGRVLKYVTDAWTYAMPPVSQKAKRQQAFFSVFEAMSRHGRVSGESQDQDAVYKLAMTSAWVSSDIALIGSRLASENARPNVYQEDEESGEQQIIKNHPYTKLLRHPNPLMSGSFLYRYTSGWYHLRGNAFWFLSTPSVGRGDISEIWPLPANHVIPLPDSYRPGRGVFRGKYVIDYEYWTGHSIEILPGENVVHFRSWNPFDFWEGLSPLSAAVLGLELDRAQQTWQRDFFKDENAIPSSLISFPEDTLDADFTRLVAEIKGQLSQGQKRIFTRAGDVSVDVISQTLEQMQIVESREFTRSEIDRIYGIPDGLISGGLSGDSRLSSEISLARNVIQPTADYFAEEQTANIAPFYGDDICFKSPNLIPQDRSLEIQEYTVYGMDRSIQENRRERGLDPITLPPEYAEYQDILEIPTRLLTIVQSASEIERAQEQATQEAANQEKLLQQKLQHGNNGGGMPRDGADKPKKPKQQGNLPAAAKPSETVSDYARRSVEALARKTELKQWRKVALKKFQDGEEDWWTGFTFKVYNMNEASEIAEDLALCDDEEDIKSRFTRELEALDDWEKESDG